LKHHLLVFKVKDKRCEVTKCIAVWSSKTLR